MSASRVIARAFSTSYCFYVLALLVALEYYAIMGTVGDWSALNEASEPLRHSPPLFAVNAKEERGSALAPPTLEKKEILVVGDKAKGCRVLWSHPRQPWDGFNLPCPPAIANQVKRSASDLIQVASIVPQNRMNSKAQCIQVEGSWYCMPTFLIVGAPFSGSRTVLKWFAGHPRVVSSTAQGTAYLSIPKGEEKDVWQYFQATCPTAAVLPNPPEVHLLQGEPQLVGDDHGPDVESSPWTLANLACFDHAPSLLADQKASITAMRAPWARTAAKVVLLKNPVDRLIDHLFAEHPDWEWKDIEYAVKVAAGDFRECACAKISQLTGSAPCADATLTSSAAMLWPLSVPALMDKAYGMCKRHLQESFIEQGFYLNHLRNWLSVGFKPSQFKIVLYDDLRTSPMETMSSVFQHVGLALRGGEMHDLEQRLSSNYGRISFLDVPKRQGTKTEAALKVRKLVGALYSQHNARLSRFLQETWEVSLPW